MHLEGWQTHPSFSAITFDDAWESFYINAYPILKQRNIPFTVFISIELLDKPYYITTEQLLELSQCHLCTIGSHGIHHSPFAKMNRNQIEKEFESSKTIIENIIEKEVILFAFPYGSYAACGFRYKSLALKYYKYAFSTIPTPIRKCCQNNYFLPRINVN